MVKTGNNRPLTNPFFLPPPTRYTTAADYNNFLQALVTGNGLSASMHKLLFTDTVSVKKNNATISEPASHISWGLGVGIQRNELGTAAWHWGDNGDFKCFFMAFPGQNNSIVYFTNSNNGLDVVPDVLTYYFGKNTWWALQWLDKDF